MGRAIDLKGQRFGRWLALERAGSIGGHAAWLCRCDCGKEKVVVSRDLRRGDSRSCGCLKSEAMSKRNRENNPSRRLNLTGKRFNMLTAIKYNGKKGNSHTWLCVCDCGNETIARTGALTSGQVKSCGCLQKIMSAKNPGRKRLLNTYKQNGESCIGHTVNTNRPFIVDKDDLDKIRGYTWRENKQGYIETHIMNKNTNKRGRVFLHRLILGIDDENIIVDHANNKREDNRKCNLRPCNPSQNIINAPPRKDNTSGVTGVHFSKREQKWCAGIGVHGKQIFLGCFANKEDAVSARKRAEIEYYGPFAYS